MNPGFLHASKYSTILATFPTQEMPLFGSPAWMFKACAYSRAWICDSGVLPEGVDLSSLSSSTDETHRCSETCDGPVYLGLFSDLSPVSLLCLQKVSFFLPGGHLSWTTPISIHQHLTLVYNSLFIFFQPAPPIFHPHAFKLYCSVWGRGQLLA